MSKFNLQFYINSYSDALSSNAPSLQNFRWVRSINGLDSSNPESLAFSLAPGETKTLFSGERTLNQGVTTAYNLTLKPLSSNTYILERSAGTNPDFRTSRATGSDATTQVSVTVNGPVATFTSVSGTLFSFIAGGVIVGDFLRVGNPTNPSSQVFSAANRGEFKVLARTATSISVENSGATIEGPIVLGSDFAKQIQVYSSAGVQIGDTIEISGGFSSVSHGSYQITDVGAQFVAFYFTETLPQESGILTQAIDIYSVAKKFVYLESDKKCSLSINGQSSGFFEPLTDNNSVKPGIFVKSGNSYSLEITNLSTDTAQLFFACIE